MNQRRRKRCFFFALSAIITAGAMLVDAKIAFTAKAKAKMNQMRTARKTMTGNDDRKKLRSDAESIFRAAVAAADPRRCVREAFESGNVEKILTEIGAADAPIILVGFGKASAGMAAEAEKILGDRILGGVIVTRYGYGVKTSRVKVVEAGHPTPDAAGVQATRELIDVIRKAPETALVLVMISGGGSALLAQPAEGLTLDDLRKTTDSLLSCGATINEINALRKHLSQVKGGRLAALCAPRPVLSLILSDVVGDPVDVIASGPTTGDTTTFADCIKIVKKYKLQSRLPAAVWRHLEKGANGRIAETPKPDAPIFARVRNLIVGSNVQALQAGMNEARRLGYNAVVLSAFVQGEAREIAKVYAAIAREELARNRPVPRPACILAGGETTVTLRGEGRGGRNQELALAAAVEIDGLSNVVILSGATDGTDGPTDAAGGVVDGTTCSRARQLGLSPQAFLSDNNSYPFLKQLGDALVTGPTGTNVIDVHIILVGDGGKKTSTGK